MNGKFRHLLRDNAIKISLLFSLIVTIVNLLVTVFFFPKLPPYIPFFNSLPWGESRLADSYLILFLSAMFIAVITLNTFLAFLLYKNHPFIARILSVTSFLFVLLGFLASLQIIFLVF